MSQIEQTTVDLVLEEEEEYLFEVVGKKYEPSCSWSLFFSDSQQPSFSTVYLTGNYIGAPP